MLLKKGWQAPERLFFCRYSGCHKIGFTSYENMLKQGFVITCIFFTNIWQKKYLWISKNLEIFEKSNSKNEYSVKFLHFYWSHLTLKLSVLLQ